MSEISNQIIEKIKEEIKQEINKAGIYERKKHKH